MEVFFRVSFHWDLFQLINGLVLTDFNVRPLCPVNVTSFQSYELTWKYFLSLVENALFFQP